MFTTFTQITPAIHLRRTRVLPVSGTVMVRQGQKVKSEDIIAEAVIPTHHELVDVVRILGLSNSKAADALIQRRVGETLGEGDILAETGGIFSRVIRTPGPGKVISIHDGQILIQTGAQTLSIQARYSGIIIEIIPDRGAVIETSGALIQGAWGNGKFAVGPLLCKAETKTSIISPSDLEITARGSIIASAVCIDEKIFEEAASLPVAGLIFGVIPSALREAAIAQPYPILLTDGFGRTGMNFAALKYLSQYNNHELTLNAGIEEDSLSQKPEVIIDASVDEQAPAISSRVTSGQMVRIHTTPFLGQVGTVEKILPGLTTLPNGLRVSAASVIMVNRERKTIPVNNLDVIGFAQFS